MNLPHHTAYDFIVYKDHKINLKFVFPIHGINFRIQQVACSLINHRITIHYDIFLKSLPCEFPYCIIYRPLIIHMLINDLLLSFIQARHTGRDIRTKNNLLIPFDGVFDSFFRFDEVYSTFVQVLTDVLFIYY